MSVLHLHPKVLEETEPANSTFDNLEASCKRESAASPVLSGQPAASTQTEQAKQALLDGIAQILGAVASTTCR